MYVEPNSGFMNKMSRKSTVMIYMSRKGMLPFPDFDTLTSGK